jgi:uncharacterized protein YggU (UPF0235/DUF167 family)
MKAKSCLAIAGLVLVVAAVQAAPASRDQINQIAGWQDAVKSQAAQAAVKASPDLVNMLAKEIGASPGQAAIGAGALLGLAKTRLKPDEFSQVAGAVPGIDALLKAVPGGGAGGGDASQMLGLGSAASAFTKLGLKPDAITKAVPALVSFVTKGGGAGVGGLLAGVLK